MTRVIAMKRAVQAPDFPLTDLGNAARFVHAHGNDLRHVRAWGQWLVWSGSHWAADERGEAIERAKAVASEMLTSAARERDDGKRAALARHALRTQSAGGIRAMVTLAATDARIAITPTQLDSDPRLLNVANGTVDLGAGRLREHAREDLITRCIAASFDTEATCPTWDAFLARVLPDAELRAFVQRLAGYTMTGLVAEHVLAFLHGTGANGKTVFIETLLRLLGSYALQAPPELMLSKRGESHPTEVASLHRMRMVVCSEIDSDRAFADAQLKRLCGGDTLTARRMREDFWSFAPTHKLWLVGNHKPRVRGDDSAAWRRIRLVPFGVVIPESERDPRLGEKLAREANGILRWCVEGCVAWQRGGLGSATAVTDATREYRAEQDIVGRWIDERCELGPDYRVPFASLVEDIGNWARTNGEEWPTATALGEDLSRRAIATKRGAKGVRVRVGIRLRRSDDE